MLDGLLAFWFGSVAVSIAYVAWDLLARTPAMGVMKWGWVVVTLYTGPIGLVAYVASCRKPRGERHEEWVAPLWKQAVGSTIHCLAGDATGIIVAGAITGALGLAMGIDLIVEYVAGFAFGLFIFQALFAKEMLGGSYLAAVRRTFIPEWLSMNAVMAGMILVMVPLMSADMRAMEPTSLRFWGVMSAATLVGATLAYPVNVWLVWRGLKHGMGTERALGKGGRSVTMEPSDEAEPASGSEVVRVAVLTTVVLGLAVLIAAQLGDMSQQPMAARRAYGSAATDGAGTLGFTALEPRSVAPGVIPRDVVDR